MKCCRQDGLILKPDRPLTTINAVISDWATYNSVSQGELYSTRTTINNQTFHIIFASAMKRDYTIYPSMIGAQSGTNPLNVSSIQCHNSSICLWYVSPLQSLNDPSGSEYALLGEWNKWTAVSQQRFTSIVTDATKNQATITVQGVSSEIVPIVVSHSVLKSVTVKCTFSAMNGQAQVVITPSNIVCS